MVGTTLGESSSKWPGPGSCKRFSWMFTSPLIGTSFLQNTNTSIVFPTGSQERQERDFLGNAVGGRINGSAEPLSYQVLLRDAALFNPQHPLPSIQLWVVQRAARFWPALGGSDPCDETLVAVHLASRRSLCPGLILLSRSYTQTISL